MDWFFIKPVIENPTSSIKSQREKITRNTLNVK